MEQWLTPGKLKVPGTGLISGCISCKRHIKEYTDHIVEVLVPVDCCCYLSLYQNAICLILVLLDIEYYIIIIAIFTI